MQVKTVSVEYVKKLQGRQQYESNTVGVTLWADLDEGEDVDQAMHALWEMATVNVRAKVTTLDKGAQAEWQETYLGLPVRLQEAADRALRVTGARVNPPLGPHAELLEALGVAAQDE